MCYTLFHSEGTNYGHNKKKEGMGAKIIGILAGKENHQKLDYRYMSDYDILFSLCKHISRSACDKYVIIARERYPYEAASVVNAIRNKRPEESAISTAASEFFKKVVKKHLLGEMFKKPKPHGEYGKHEGGYNHYDNHNNYNNNNYNNNYNQHQEDANWLHNQEVEARNHYQNAMNNYRNQQLNNPIPTYNGVPMFPSPFPNQNHNHH